MSAVPTLPCFAALALLALAGCAQTYSPPVTGPVATLRLVTEMNDGGNIPAVQYEQADCSDHPGKRFAFLNSYALGNTFSHEAITTIAAGKPFIFSVFAIPLQDVAAKGADLVVTQGYCAPVMKFLPGKGGSYLAVHRATRQACSIDVYRIDGVTGRQTPEPSAVKNTQCSQTLKQQ